MSIKIGNYSFEGPYNDTSYLQDKSGVYAILCKGNPNYKLVDIGESATIKSRIENHDRKNCWTRNCSSTLEVAVLYWTAPLRLDRLG